MLYLIVEVYRCVCGGGAVGGGLGGEEWMASREPTCVEKHRTSKIIQIQYTSI